MARQLDLGSFVPSVLYATQELVDPYRLNLHEPGLGVLWVVAVPGFHIHWFIFQDLEEFELAVVT